MSENTLVNEENVTQTEATPNAEIEAQEEVSKTYSQKEVDDMMARMKGSISRKFENKYADLGDVEELRNLKAEAEKRQQEQQIKRGEFEKTLQELASKKDAEIQKRDSIIKEYKVNTPLLNSAAKYRSVNPEQVKSLLANQVRLNDEGDVEVVDTTGSVRYNDAGQPIGVDDLVREFLDLNPHFVAPTPTTTNTKSSVSNMADGKLDISKLDMKNPEHRKLYAQAREKGAFSITGN
jgi:hypothetical protein